MNLSILSHSIIFALASLYSHLLIFVCAILAISINISF